MWAVFVTNVYCLLQLSPLHVAAKRGDPEKVKKLVSEGEDVDIKDPGSGVSTLDSIFTTDDFSYPRKPRKGLYVHCFCNLLFTIK